jgi:hypothetical protein
MNPLELRDIHLPEASLWWPPASGWWLLLLLVILVCLLLPRWLRRSRQKPLRGSSLSQFKRIRQEHRNGLNDKAVVEQVSTLLRRILISYCGRDGNAASTGDAWLTQLASLSGTGNFSREQLDLLAFARYQADFDCDIGGLLDTCESWIKSLPRGRHVSA